VEEYLEAKVTEAVSMADLPLITGIGIRAIQATFRRHRGYSTSGIPEIDTAQASERLRSAKATRVIDVAYDCGFAKLKFQRRLSAAFRRAAVGNTVASAPHGAAAMTALDVMWVGLGGGLGSLLRWWIGRVVGERYRGDFPLGTFLINVSGSFVIGFSLPCSWSTGATATARRSILFV
jgi:hypothetical protein